ncbi:VWA domain-containing protein [Phycicoccus sp. MAQZ13P-2]|uniref:vWA domain-containing protein n=1 Tax=Phycicoccus mangrovi TaxID=2840470 RepID=UPI001C007C9F|nr:VWA domain-containing protein [Phycicoccus mangrovi]MBT9257957.1 VWA domain-containing protein [Phycicoccus mangrovi]MBT9276221.1 VWA domain-containing protein [Phycicoccus mangrovi]
MPRHARRALALAATLMTTALLVAPPATATAPTRAPAGGIAAEDDPADSRLLLLLDASGSMKRPDPSGLSKMEAAKQALTAVVRDLPADSSVGLRVYGAEVDGGGRPTKAACADTRLVQPVGPLDRAAMTRTIKGFRALGETPIARSLEAALDDLGPTGRRTVVLVSDGEESCVPDPCPVVRRLVGSGVDLRIDTVGFGVDAAARRQLTCIARAGGGTYYDAKNADELATNLTRLSVRAARQFGTSGTRVAGTTGPEGAPVLTAGQYVDTFTSGAAPEHLVVRRTIPRSTLHVSFVARPGVDLEGDDVTDDVIEFRAEDARGSSCTSLPGRAQRIGLSSLASVVSDSLVLPGGTAQDPERCGDLTDIPLRVTRTGSGTPVDAEILVVEEPPVTDVDALPEPAPEADPVPSTVDAGAARPVVGGTDFGSATPVTAGTWTEQYVSGETIYYRVPVQWGQQVKLTVGPVRPATDEFTGPLFDANLFDPTRGRVSAGPLGTLGRPDSRVVRESAPVRYRNREDFPTRFSSLAGQYYVAISVPRVDSDVTVPLDVTFRLEVAGEASAAPAYATSTQVSSPSPVVSATPTVGSTDASTADSAATAERAPGLPGWVWVAGGLVAATAAVVGAAVLASRRDVARDRS